MTADAALAPQILHSRSGQFIVSGLPMLTRSWAVSTSAVSFVRLDPALVAVSCEGIKAALLDTLGLPDRWKGSVLIALHPIIEDNEPIDVTSVHHQGGWKYQVNVPDQVDRSRFIRAIVEVLTFEIANREASARQAELPPWLIPGLAKHLEATALAGLALEPRTSLIGQGRRSDTLGVIRASLRASKPLSIDQLNWPEEVRSDEQERVYDGCAQLLVYDLLRLKNGRQYMADMLKRSHETLNWQTAFFQAFAPHFQRLIDWDKWWSMRVVEVSQKEAFVVFTSAEQLRQLEEILTTRTVASDTNATESVVTLQTIIADWPLTDQSGPLQQKISLLRALKMRANGSAAVLIGEYMAIIDQYLQDRTHGKAGHGRSGDVAASSRIFAQTTIKRLNQLDARRESLNR